MNVVVYEMSDVSQRRLIPLLVRPEIAKSMSFQEGDTVTQWVADKIRTASHYYTLGRSDALLEQLDDLQRGTQGSGKDDVGDAPSGLGDLPVAASHSRAA